MKISYNWLKDYLDIDLNPNEVSEILTDIGLEVEGLEEIETVKGGLNGLVIGEVTECAKHPDADKLSVTKVDVGTGKLLNIVCGAPNVAKGQKVVVATIGTTLYNGDDSFTIKKTKLRGELSGGMICAEDEIGLGTSHDGIMVLDNNAKVGSLAKDYFNVQNEVVFEIGLTPNRIDSASHFGVARDLAAFLNLKKKVDLKKPDVSSFKAGNNSNQFKVEIRNSDLCPRYSGLYIKGIEVKSSPEWLQIKLRSIGLNPINNIVDITNFILHEIGQPMHAFDADILDGQKIIVKILDQKSKFTTLDGEEHEIETSDLMICDSNKAVALAGIFGGLESGVTENTKNIFLESAYFNPVTVRKTAKRLGISTDSSFRFERGTDPDNTVYAIKRAATLIKELAGGEIVSEIIDNYPQKIEKKQIAVSFKNIDRLIGKKIEKTLIIKILQNLEIEILEEDKDELRLSVPLYRVDVTREADIIEEILRIYGYNNVEIPDHVNSTLTYTPHPDFEKYTNQIADFLSNIGFTEIMCNSISKSAYYEGIETFSSEKLVKIVNPLSSDLNCMRQNLLFGGLESIVHNINRQNPNLRMYEFGNCYYFDHKNNNTPLDKYSEEKHLAVFICGKITEQSWQDKEKDVTFFELKKYVELIFSKLALNGVKYSEIKNDIFSYGLECSRGKEVYGSFGLLNKTIVKLCDIKVSVFYAEFNWDLIVNAIMNNTVTFKELPKYPEVRRDLALLLDKSVTFDKIQKIAKNTERKLLKQINLFDIFEDEKIGKDKKSYAVSFTLQDKNSTLTDNQIDGIMNKLIKAFEKELNAVIR